MTELFDWRGYARERGVTPLRAWIAMQQATRSRYPSGVSVSSPASLDAICRDDTMHDFVRAVIDEAALP